MYVYLMHNNSENNVIGKNYNIIETVEAHNKNEMSVENPILILKYSGNIDNINYIYIPDNKRFYFIEDIKQLNGFMYEIDCKVDVLQSFRNNILYLSAIIDKQMQTDKANKYINDGSYVVQSNEFNEIVSFNQGFNENGTFILICAGG